MLITENVLEQALAQVFDGKPAGSCMTFEEITMAWNKVGLRKSDLRDALRAMVQQNCLNAKIDKDNLLFELTERGAIRFYICLYCEASLKDQLGARRVMQDENVLADYLNGVSNRRSVQH